jgi:hypothetical protein
MDKVSDTQAYRQFGNSVVVPVVERVAAAVLAALSRPVLSAPELTMEYGEPSEPEYVTLEEKPKGRARKPKASVVAMA